MSQNASRTIGVVASILVALIMPRAALGWGGEGHRIVGAVADAVLDQPGHEATKKRLQQIIGGKSLSELSVWADCAKGFSYCQRQPSPEEKHLTSQNPKHHLFHYTDIAIQQTKYRAGSAGTTPQDVVQVMKVAVGVLRGKHLTNPPAKLEPTEAVWLLTHLVGDIHQPLHVGSLYFDEQCATVVNPNVTGAGKLNFGIGSVVADTQGGNALKVGSKPLHSYWDSSTVDGVLKGFGGSGDAFIKAALSNPPQGWKTPGEPETWGEQWATEILPLSRRALTQITIGQATKDAQSKTIKCTWPVKLKDGYAGWATQQTATQLAKAGYRLAAILDAALAP